MDTTPKGSVPYCLLETGLKYHPGSPSSGQNTIKCPPGYSFNYLDIFKVSYFILLWITKPVSTTGGKRKSVFLKVTEITFPISTNERYITILELGSLLDCLGVSTEGN